ncbi:MAG: 4-alpha-glucanotransferase [Bacteroidaceae bacterium]|nr:4-alpha-glucanotransferase [Bacteroidaceae bacterium]
MKYIEFNVSYRIDDGSIMQVHYSFEKNNTSMCGVQPLREVRPGCWVGHLELDDNVDSLEYGYEYVRNGKVVRREWSGKPHHMHLNSVNYRYISYDRWCDAPAGLYTRTSIYRIFGGANAAVDKGCVCWYNRSVSIALYIVGLEEGEEPAISGDADALGNWRPESALPLRQVSPGLWSVTFDAERLWGGNVQFKIITRRSNGVVRWEGGDNRVISIPDYEPSSCYRYELQEVEFPSKAVHLAGTVLPLFSMRSSRGWGIGDFGDIRLMVDWLVVTGQSVLQLLPVNDTTINGGKEDSYPYNCVSVFALNPIYADMEMLPRLRSAKRNSYYQKQRQQLNALPAVDYAAVYMLKMNYFRELFEEVGDEVLATRDCKLFVKEQAQWLTPYTLFRFLTSRLRCNVWDWKEFRYYDSDTYARVVSEYPDAAREVLFYTYVQYVLYAQLRDAHSYAASKKVTLKGDIPIGVAPNGVDVWCDREQFNISVSAGAPPDVFSADGQNWGFPTYNWELMAADGYAWWRRRLQYMSKFFDAYRIDHILGFFRIWEIPRWAVSGLAGHFSPSRPMTRSEITSMGFNFDSNEHTLPIIYKEAIDSLFAEKSDAVTEYYFCKRPDGNYTFKPEYALPQNLTLSFATNGLEFDRKECESILRLFNEVLFIKDGAYELYTPRISAFDTAAYVHLAQSDRAAYDRIYEHFYYNRHTMFWFEEGMRKLSPLLECTSMTACGEDLGMIPACVPWVMKNLQILSLEIQRMPKVYGQTFANPAEYPYLSVATPSTHDMSTLRGWWCEDAVLSQQFYNHVLGFEGKAPVEMDGRTAHAIIQQHLNAPSMLALFAWQDLMAMDERLRRGDHNEERINVPSNRDHVWNYRMHIPLEQLLKERGFNDTLRSMIAGSGRG